MRLGIITILLIFLFQACTIKVTTDITEDVYVKESWPYFDAIDNSSNFGINIYKNCNYCFKTIKRSYLNLVDNIQIFVANETLFIKRNPYMIYQNPYRIEIYVPRGHPLHIYTNGGINVGGREVESKK